MNSTYRALICAVIRGETPQWPDEFDADQATQFIDFAQLQGVPVILNQHTDRLHQANWPAGIITALAISSVANQRLHATRRHYVSEICGQLERKGITGLLFKGAATAYQLYDEPSLRQHADIDMLIDENQVQQLDQLMLENGYQLDDINVTQFGPFQKCASIKPKHEPAIIFDIHWRINNRLVLARCLDYDELSQESEKLKYYQGSVYAIGISDALLLACIHEAGGESLEKHRLSGLYDIHLILNRLTDAQLTQAAQRAIDKGIGTILIYAINQSLDAFADNEQKQRIKQLLAPLKFSKSELSARLLKPNKTWLDEKRLDYAAVESADKIDYLISKIKRKLIL